MPRVPVAEDSMWPLQPEPAPPGARTPRKVRTADPLAELADQLSRGRGVGEPAEQRRPPRLQPAPPARSTADAALKANDRRDGAAPPREPDAQGRGDDDKAPSEAAAPPPEPDTRRGDDGPKSNRVRLQCFARARGWGEDGELARKHGISEATLYNWKARYGGMETCPKPSGCAARRREPQAEEAAGGIDARQRRAQGVSFTADLVRQSVAAQGGAAALSSAKTTIIKGEAKHWEPGQSYSPTGEARFLGDSTYTQTVDNATRTARVDWDRT